MHATAMNPMHHRRLMVIVGALLLLAVGLGAGMLYRQVRREPLVIPDERAVAAALLEKKLSGPRYFHPTPVAAGDHRNVETPISSDGEPRISVADARAQVERVVGARHFDEKQAVRVRKLIDRLIEPPDSRIIGEPTINLLKLNLALDELH